MLDHVRVVVVVEHALAGALVRGDNILTHKENNMRDESTDLRDIVRTQRWQ